MWIHLMQPPPLDPAQDKPSIFEPCSQRMVDVPDERAEHQLWQLWPRVSALAHKLRKEVDVAESLPRIPAEGPPACTATEMARELRRNTLRCTGIGN